jgi:hypothetical protein
MNSTNFEHAGYALLMQLPFGMFGYWWVGAALAIGFFIGREHSQREEIISGKDRSNPFPAFKIWEWSLDAQFDLLVPVVVVTTLAVLFSGVPNG